MTLSDLEWLKRDIQWREAPRGLSATAELLVAKNWHRSFAKCRSAVKTRSNRWCDKSSKPLMGTLKPHSNRPLYSDTVIDTLAANGWAVTFGTARRGLSGLWSPSPFLAVLNVTAHPSTASVQLQIIRCGTIIASALWRVNRLAYLSSARTTECMHDDDVVLYDCSKTLQPTTSTFSTLFTSHTSNSSGGNSYFKVSASQIFLRVRSGASVGRGPHTLNIGQSLKFLRLYLSTPYSLTDNLKRGSEAPIAFSSSTDPDSCWEFEYNINTIQIKFILRQGS